MNILRGKNTANIIIIPVIFFLFSGFIAAQFFYDAQKMPRPETTFLLTPPLYKSLDLGLHSAFASIVWINNRLEILKLSDRNKKFLDNFDLVSYLDPKLSAPYAFAVLVMPSALNYSDRINTAVEIGKKGVIEADPDWRIPFYVAVNYHIYLKNREEAAKYFDIAARTPGVPFITKRFSENYLSLNYQEQIKQIWKTIYETARDKETKERAANYLVKIEMFEFLEKAGRAYKAKTGIFPKKIDDLVSGGILKKIPKDPFGYTYHFLEDGRLQVDQ